MKTVMSTDWIEVHYHGSVCMARVFLTDEDKAYMISIQNGKQRFFKIDPKFLKIGEQEFFESVMESAEEVMDTDQLKVNLLDELL